MQTVFKNEDKGDISRRTDLVDIIVYVRRIGRHLEEEHIRRPRRRVIGI